MSRFKQLLQTNVKPDIVHCRPRFILLTQSSVFYFFSEMQCVLRRPIHTSHHLLYNRLWQHAELNHEFRFYFMNKYMNHDIINKRIHIHKKQCIIMSCCHNYAFTRNKEGDCPVQCTSLHFLIRPLCTWSNHSISNWTQSSHTKQSNALPCKLRDRYGTRSTRKTETGVSMRPFIRWLLFSVSLENFVLQRYLPFERVQIAFSSLTISFTLLLASEIRKISEIVLLVCLTV